MNRLCPPEKRNTGQVGRNREGRRYVRIAGEGNTFTRASDIEAGGSVQTRDAVCIGNPSLHQVTERKESLRGYNAC